MNTEDLFNQIAFIKEIDKVKYIQRKTKLFDSDRNENDAEHSWHLALMAIVLAEHSDKPIDVLKVVKMVLIHDIVEIDSGDVVIQMKNDWRRTVFLVCFQRNRLRI
jgi:putative hydrolase of HD superfamily